VADYHPANECIRQARDHGNMKSQKEMTKGLQVWQGAI
jgi:hypothetical protein